uniref:Uncharacterized protein n=1 Tax=Eucampia antarctica TaxID=49252 RepID=A0A7S2R1X0_9STRA|mmetsp:Transcript_13551/g.13131  ORF Transcript_13551/g.13131 Transcript_13551/m.13131 type:complete len:123 (+) Transcript_13551:119-487(+)|eukprot:CAMPEP_0197831686 /NCGR_PEP_ID=MMETSP1437-20131217/11559_1 /TAXON_ID=49252 ORGANISM="Eucampia antarctica, Strain CCMP1452" /NCGR_SAMPLE_ID=MMETSP1437 /ASSEMBLY_ACC=CAM_ASM_001096 /LENGTH=122 /DNA_ID=CAMNT_0043434711 /DNA_START=106 /DNA_END=474 /DNA_ORIENTATION=+
MVMIAIQATARRSAVVAVRHQQRRQMGGHAPAPEWTGIDKVVRGYFPQDHQLAGAILGGYGVVIALGMLKSKLSSSDEEPAPVVVAPVAAITGDIPSVESAEFDTFIENESNLMKWVDSLEK